MIYTPPPYTITFGILDLVGKEVPPKMSPKVTPMTDG
jgi:hypothetical protein